MSASDLPAVPRQPQTGASSPWSADYMPWLVAMVGLAILYLPAFWDLRKLWAADDQGHAPIILAVTGWLLWRQRAEIMAGEGDTPAPLFGYATIFVAAAAYVVGRSQSIQFLEIGSLVPMLAGLVLLMRGPRTLKRIWFPLFFLCFMVPLPAALVATVTGPMKIAVSYVAEAVMRLMGYPIARSGVILQVGPYQLLVADACAGLHTLLTLEALGLLYLNVVRSSSMVRNVALAILVVPISFVANVIRVITLTLVTYHLGDEAGQGFLHGFAGMVLFLSALMLIVSMDSAINAMRSMLGRAPRPGLQP